MFSVIEEEEEEEEEMHKSLQL